LAREPIWQRCCRFLCSWHNSTRIYLRHIGSESRLGHYPENGGRSFSTRIVVNSCSRQRPPSQVKVRNSMWIPSLSMTDTRLFVALKLSGVLASLCVVSTILMANAFPLSWVALWPGAFSVLPIAVFLYLRIPGEADHDSGMILITIPA
jgi:hypothetical protein